MGRFALLAATLLLAACAHQRTDRHRPASAEATLLLFNGVIFTARDEREVVDALAIAGDKILAAGRRRDLRRFIGSKTRSVDLKGRFVSPGFHDAHLHFEAGGRSLAMLNFYGVKSLDRVLEAVRKEVARLPDGAWVIGRGWDHTLWEGQRWPTRQDLDRVAPDNPVYLRRADGHVVWVNSKALAAAGVNEKTAAPKAGEIVRERGSRRPSGILKEAAVALVEPARSSASSARRHLELALGEARRLGVTSVQDGGSSLEQLVRLREAGKLTVRVYWWGKLDGPLDRFAALRRRHPRADPLLAFGSLKGFVDGTLGSSTAALLAPYQGKPAAARGTLNYTQAKLDELVRRATRRGFQVNLHAIGDRAVRQALRAFVAALPGGAKALRHRVEHAQLVHPDDLALFERTGAVASVQPCHLATDQRWVDRRVGVERGRRRGYLWRTLQRRGVPLALGTDWPVEPLSPLRNLYSAVTRRRVDPPRGDGWNAGQRLTIGAALRAYTYGSAYAAFAEQRRGTLTAGMDADLVLLDRDLLKIPAEQLLETRVLATMLAGRVIYGRLE